jgi:hypothetical protein
MLFWHFEGRWQKEQDPESDPQPGPFVQSTDPRIRIPTKMSWIRNTGCFVRIFFFFTFFPVIKLILSFACMILWGQVKLQSYRATEKDDIINEKVESKKNLPRNWWKKIPGNKQHVREGDPEYWLEWLM